MNLEEFRAYAKISNVIPVSRRLLADGETPLGVYRKLAKNAANTFLLNQLNMVVHGHVIHLLG
jgi:anthranilate synthase component 1